MEFGKHSELASKIIAVLGVVIVLFLLKTCAEKAIETAGNVYDGAVDIAEDVAEVVVPEVNIVELSNHEAFVPFCKIIGNVVVTAAIDVTIELSDEFSDLSRVQKEGVKFIARIIALKGIDKNQLNDLCRQRIEQQAAKQVSGSKAMPESKERSQKDAE